MFLDNQKNGFTLIEVLIYIALFTLLIGGSIVTALTIFDGSARLDASAQSEIELNFVLKKIKWLLRNSHIIEPTAFVASEYLEVQKDGGTYRLYTSPDGDVLMDNGTSSSQLTEALTIDTMLFKRIISTPDRITIDLTIDGEQFTQITHYVR